MRFDCHITLTASDTVVVGVRKSGTGGWKYSAPRTGSTVDLVLYNFDPSYTYEYRVVTTDDSTTATALTGGPSLPTLVGDIKWQITRSLDSKAKYVLLDAVDCQHTMGQYYLLVLNTITGRVVWYQDINAATGGTTTSLRGWSYTPDGTILAATSAGEIYEWGWDGAAVAGPVDLGAGECQGAASDNGPCAHHDVARGPDGSTYAIMGSMDFTYDPSTNANFSGCHSGSDYVDSYINDGFREYDSSWATTVDVTLIGDLGYDPDADPGPSPSCNTMYWLGYFDTNHLVEDWTHVNAISAFGTLSGDRVALSSRVWSDVILVDPASPSTPLWRLSGTWDADSRGDFTMANAGGVSGPTDFGGQHNVEAHLGQVQMFDNRWETWDADTNARGICIDVDPMSGVATITRNWTMRRWDSVHSAYAGLDCHEGQGSAQIVPGSDGDNMLLDCGPQNIIQEIAEYDGGLTTAPLLDVSIDSDSTGGFDECQTQTDPTSASPAWYRAWPLGQLGEF